MDRAKMATRLFGVLVFALGILLLNLTAFAQERTVITYSAWGNIDEIEMENRLIEAFEARHPEIQVQLLAPTGSYSEALAVWISGGVAPDVISLNRTSYPRFANALQHIPSERFDTSVYLSPQLIDSLTYEGRQLGVPKRMNTKVMIYDRGAFDNANLDYPTPDWTPHDYASVAQQLMLIRGDEVVRWGSGPLVIWNWFTKFGAPLLSGDGKTALLNSAEVQAATLFMANLHKRYAAWFDDFPNFDAALANGQMAMFADVGPWYIPAFLENAGFDWAIAPVPGNPLTPEITGLSISATTQHLDAALKFVEFVSTDPAAQAIVANSTNLPVTSEAAQIFVERAPGRGLETFFSVFTDDYRIPDLQAVTLSPIEGQIWNTFYNEILLHHVDPLTGLNQLQQVAQAYLDEQNR